MKKKELVNKFNNAYNLIKNKFKININYLTNIISIIALLISISSYLISRDSLELSEKEFNSKRNIVFNADFSNQFNERLGIFFTPLNKDVKVDFFTVYAPYKYENKQYVLPTLGSDTFPYIFDPPGTWNDYSLHAIKEFIIDFHLKGIDTSKILIQNVRDIVPIVIQTDYISQNQKLSNMSLYNIYYSLTFYKKMNKNGQDSINVNFYHLSLVGKMDDKWIEYISKNRGLLKNWYIKDD